MVTRREFLIAFTASVLSPIESGAQPQPRLWRIGFLAANTPPPQILDALREGLQERGYIEGKSVSIEVREPENCQGARAHGSARRHGAGDASDRM